jgi:hypothetical protein
MPEDREKFEAGVLAIIALQLVAGIEENREAAEEGWCAMSHRERETTMETYELLRREGVCHG